jgi:hypothetical protein
MGSMGCANSAVTSNQPVHLDAAPAPLRTKRDLQAWDRPKAGVVDAGGYLVEFADVE